MSVTISLASRGRPELLKSTLGATGPNIRESGTRIVVLLDEDDEQSTGFAFDHPNVTVSVAPRAESFGHKWNRAVDIAPGSIYVLMADYTPHITPGFDTKVLEAAALFPDGIGVVYNHLANLSFPGMVSATAGLVEKMGYFCPPYFPYWFVDHWIDDIARMIGRVAFAEVDIGRHNKPATQGLQEPAFWAMLYDALVFERREQAFTIIDGEDFIEPAWRKQMLKGASKLVEERSFMINAYVRTIQAPPKPVDARYAALKDKAMAKLAEVAKMLEAA